MATIVISGPEALSIAARFFRSVTGKHLDKVSDKRILLGEWRSDDEPGPGEKLIVRRNEDGHVEIHCHGGHAAVHRIIDSLTAAGCHVVTPSTWLFEQQPDRLIAEAHLAMTVAPTLRVATILLDQFHGALTREINAVEGMIRGNDLLGAVGRLERLLEASKLGTRLTRRWRVVLAGGVNVGKSTLANAILGYRRSIVNSHPGTTRDVLSAETAIDGWPIELIDTAGLNETSDPLESDGINRSQDQFKRADLLVWVRDITQPFVGAEKQRGYAQDIPIITVHNKLDLVSSQAERPSFGICVSALNGDGFDALMSAISQQLVSLPPNEGAAIPFLDRHVDLIWDAAKNLEASNGPKAIQTLLKLKKSSASSEVGNLK